jgi:predicted flavoprotein YhiN
MRGAKMDADIIVVGAGASGLMAAGRAAECGARVLILEKTDALGQKLLVSGKTRCNVTNIAELPQFIDMYGTNGRFLYGAFHRFFRPELLAFFKRYGLNTKAERGGRIFPVSDDARDVIEVFRKYLDAHKVRVVFDAQVTAIHCARHPFFTVKTPRHKYLSSGVILAAGGSSWPATGSAGDGCKIAAKMGHTIINLRPALVPLMVREQRLAQSMQGVSLRNVRAAAFQGRAEEIDAAFMPREDYGRGETKKTKPPLIESRFGEMLFTHFGLGGPIILLMSLSVVDALQNGPVSVLIDLKPALSAEQLTNRLQRDLNTHGKKKVAGIMKEYLPAKMIDPVIALAGIQGDTPAHQVAATQRSKIVETLKALRFNIKSPLPLARAIVTAGGVSLGEIDPRTMASQKVSGLFFCGEVMDIDADTGGYNLQAAFSTGYVAGQSAAEFINSLDVNR